MAQERLSESDFIEAFKTLGAAGVAKKFNISVRSVYARRKNIERLQHTTLPSPNPKATPRVQSQARLDFNVENGTVLIASDAHYWPGLITTAHQAFVKFCKDMKPAAIVMNGDVFDGASVSRHSPIGWENNPSVIQEIEACQERLGEIESACTAAKKYWTLGNHDSRFETRLATVAPEFAKVHGVHLKDHFPYWNPCWSVWINGNVVVKHRFKGGIHATHNNALWAGKTIVTGHLHSLKVTPLSDYNGTRYGVDTGTLAEAGGPQFIDYCEDNPMNWRSGFIALTFHNGRLLWPEVVNVCGPGQVEFRGKVIEV